MAKTVAEAWDEFLGLRNEAEHSLAERSERGILLKRREDELFELIHQLVELCEMSLATVRQQLGAIDDYETRIRSSLAILAGVSQKDTFNEVTDFDVPDDAGAEI